MNVGDRVYVYAGIDEFGVITKIETLPAFGRLIWVRLDSMGKAIEVKEKFIEVVRNNR